ncbi:hypothetical protein ES703_97360 [subsurface metagenome]
MNLDVGRLNNLGSTRLLSPYITIGLFTTNLGESQLAYRWSRGAWYENGQLHQGDFVSSAMADYVSRQEVCLPVDEGILTAENYARLIFWCHESDNYLANGYL